MKAMKSIIYKLEVASQTTMTIGSHWTPCAPRRAAHCARGEGLKSPYSSAARQYERKRTTYLVTGHNYAFLLFSCYVIEVGIYLGVSVFK